MTLTSPLNHLSFAVAVVMPLYSKSFFQGLCAWAFQQIKAYHLLKWISQVAPVQHLDDLSRLNIWEQGRPGESKVGTGAGCRCLHMCVRCCLSVCVFCWQISGVLTKEKSQASPQNNTLSLFMAVSTASLFSLVLLSETPCFRVSLDFFQFFCSQFKPLQFSWAR